MLRCNWRACREFWLAAGDGSEWECRGDAGGEGLTSRSAGLVDKQLRMAQMDGCRELRWMSAAAECS